MDWVRIPILIEWNRLLVYLIFFLHYLPLLPSLLFICFIIILRTAAQF